MLEIKIKDDKSKDTILTRKNKKEKKLSHQEINNLWNQFDSENINSREKLECIYRNDQEMNLEINICTNCKQELIIGDDGFYTCENKKCGIIYKDNIDQGAEWRFYGADDNQNNDPTRCGMPINPLLKESSYSCKVLCCGKTSYEMHKIRRYTDWQAMPYKEKSQYDEFQLIINISQNAGIPKMIIDDAIYYHKKISEAKTFRGLNRDGIIAASIYVSCRVNNYPRTAKEIADIFNLDNTSSTKGCKNALLIINEIDFREDNKEILNIKKTTPLTFIDRFCSKLSINSELTNVCKFIAYKIENMKIIPENTPHSIAGGIIYFICQNCNLNISKAEINRISKISEVTINKCYKKIEEYKKDLIPEVILKKYSD